jgi:hypothetical protein
MARNDDYVVGEGEEALLDRANELAGVSAGEIRSAYGAGEEGIPGKEEGMLREVEAYGALGMTGSMEDGASETCDSDMFSVV